MFEKLVNYLADSRQAAEDAKVEAVVERIRQSREERWQKAEREWRECKVHTSCSLRAHLNEQDGADDAREYHDACSAYMRALAKKHLHCPGCGSAKLWPMLNTVGECFWNMCEQCGSPIWSCFLASLTRLHALDHKILDGLHGRDSAEAQMKCYDFVIEAQPWPWVWSQDSGWGNDDQRLVSVMAVQARREELGLPLLTEEELMPDGKLPEKLYTAGTLTAAQAIIRTHAMLSARGQSLQTR